MIRQTKIIVAGEGNQALPVDDGVRAARCVEHDTHARQIVAHHLGGDRDRILDAHLVRPAMAFDHQPVEAEEDGAEAMEQLEREILAGLGIPDPY